MVTVAVREGVVLLKKFLILRYCIAVISVQIRIYQFPQKMISKLVAN